MNQGGTSAPGNALRDCLTIALVSAAVMLYEIAITRILSVVLWYHFAFLSVSLAMIGLGVPGIWYARRRPGNRSLPRALFASGLLVPLSVAALLALGNRLPFRPAFASAAAWLRKTDFGAARSISQPSGSPSCWSRSPSSRRRSCTSATRATQ